MRANGVNYLNQSSMNGLTFGNQPTKRPPPGPSVFLMLTGRFPQCAITGYALTVPAEERCVLSAYKMNANSAPFLGKDDLD